jgi:hypothetical protein
MPFYLYQSIDAKGAFHLLQKKPETARSVQSRTNAPPFLPAAAAHPRRFDLREKEI